MPTKVKCPNNSEHSLSVLSEGSNGNFIIHGRYYCHACDACIKISIVRFD